MSPEQRKMLAILLAGGLAALLAERWVKPGVHKVLKVRG